MACAVLAPAIKNPENAQKPDGDAQREPPAGFFRVWAGEGHGADVDHFFEMAIASMPLMGEASLVIHTVTAAASFRDRHMQES